MVSKLYVGNIPFQAEQNDLDELFKQAGNVISVKIVKDTTTGKSKGFGFVEMSSDEEAKKAVDMFNGHSFLGREIIVNKARPQREER
ncbi:MAG: hypothetical protein A2149_04985 [Candidatus Schekmanbacteria bacterium RBG_16_38_11]|uniref:RRM domain-containing protein n=1 Tax=Candidatus Schekmanbacteria bacterium RBG_16_38_11 TaxID=1817880 RepID=A0A1F7RZY8_9BACT|nr:MAG: hypothetical protein A2149_04985 [Candidatus Schekmanbacteria bacterium RBG_16_38_11]